LRAPIELAIPMIVRINQLDAAQVERDSGWLSGGLMGPLGAAAGGAAGAPGAPSPWPSDLRAFELLILGQDEQQRPLTETFRQTQLRHIIPEASAALREPGEEIVVRLDGPLSEGELVPAFRRLTDAAGFGRFAFSPAQKLQLAPQTVVGSVRLVPTYKSFVGLCADSTLGLERSVRLRAIAVPESLTNAVLETGPADDPRWAEVLPKAGFLIGPSRGLRSLQILTRRLDAATVKSRIMQRLLSGAGASGAEG
jgi:hypothetical protein